MKNAFQSASLLVIFTKLGYLSIVYVISVFVTQSIYIKFGNF